jgi:hypothetical protein
MYDTSAALLLASARAASSRLRAFCRRSDLDSSSMRSWAASLSAHRPPTVTRSAARVSDRGLTQARALELELRHFARQLHVRLRSRAV